MNLIYNVEDRHRFSECIIFVFYYLLSIISSTIALLAIVVY